MSTPGKDDLLPGTVELLILVTLRREPLHGYANCSAYPAELRRCPPRGRGFRYPVLQRMRIEGWVSAKWGVSARNRRIRIYTITPDGRKQLTLEMKRVGRVI